VTQVTKVILIAFCADCPYCYHDKYGYLDSEYYCDISNKDISDNKKLPTWCTLTDEVEKNEIR